MQVELSITKATDFQGKPDEYSNTYTYTGVADDDAAIEALVDAVVAAEVPIFGNDVTFKRARAWGGEGIQGNYMRVSKDLTQIGTAGVGSVMYRECAILLRWKLPTYVGTFASLSNPRRRVTRYLRKYLHTNWPHGYNTAGNGGPRSTSPDTKLLAYASAVTEPIAGVKLCAPNGDIPVSAATQSPYLEHRQFPRGRKEGIG